MALAARILCVMGNKRNKGKGRNKRNEEGRGWNKGGAQQTATAWTYGI